MIVRIGQSNGGSGGRTQGITGAICQSEDHSFITLYQRIGDRRDSNGSSSGSSRKSDGAGERGVVGAVGGSAAQGVGNGETASRSSFAEAEGEAARCAGFSRIVTSGDAEAGVVRRVLKESGIAEKFSHKGIEVAIVINIGKGGIAIVPDIAQAEGVDDGSGKAGCCPGARVLEEKRVAVKSPHKGIEVAIAIHISKGRTGVIKGEGSGIDIAQPKGVGDGSGKAGRCPSARVLEVPRVAILFSDESIKVAIAINIGKGGLAVSPHITKGAGCCHKGRSGGCARVAEKQRVAVTVSNEGIEVAIAINIGKIG
ncbi:MAG: hypothetical protein V7L24_13550 [Nostoc sp.]